MKKVILIVTLCTSCIGGLFAQSIQPANTGNMVYGGVGLDGAVVIEGGYVTPRFFDIAPLDISLAIPTGKVFYTPGSYRFGLHTHWDGRFSGNWGYNLKPGTRIYTMRSPAWAGFAWYVDMQVQAGYIAPNWALTLDLGLAPKITTYISPSDEAKQNFSAIQPGFYAKGFEGLFNYGLSGYWRFSDHFAAGLKVWLTVPLEESQSPLARGVADGVVSLHTTYYFNAPQPGQAAYK